MSAQNLTKSEAQSNSIDIFVPLFRNDKKDIGIHIKIYERFGAWSFEMETDLCNHNSSLNELFTELCRQAGLRRRIICAIDLEIGKRDGDYEFIFAPCGALGSGDYFTPEAILHLISTAFIPYWQLAARQINELDQRNGLSDTISRAEAVLGKWDEFNKVELCDSAWEKAWHEANCNHDRKKLIKGDNWRIARVDRPLERFPEHCRKSAR